MPGFILHRLGNLARVPAWVPHSTMTMFLWMCVQRPSVDTSGSGRTMVWRVALCRRWDWSMPASLMGSTGWYKPRDAWTLHWMRPYVIQTTWAHSVGLVAWYSVSICRVGSCFVDAWIEGGEIIVMNVLSRFTMGDSRLDSSTKKASRGSNRVMMFNCST